MQPSEKDFELARVMLDHSLRIKPKEKVLITVSSNAAFVLAKAVYIETLKRGAYPQLDMEIDSRVGRSSYEGVAYQFFKLANEWQLSYVPEEIIKAKVAWADAYVLIATEDTMRDLVEIDPEKLARRAKLLRPLMDPRTDSDRWVLTYYPTHVAAVEAGMSLDSLTEFYYGAVLVDYKKMKSELSVLEKVLDEGREVRVVGKQTDLTIGIEGRLAQACYGEANLPDGEVFLGPVHTRVEGEVYFDMPVLIAGREVRGIRVEFEKGKVIHAIAEYGQEALTAMLETDEGARYLGEFAIGTNYAIDRSMKSMIYDEKIGGTVHMAFGRSYTSKRGGGKNVSAVHQDIVKDMRLPGSRVEVDGRVILKDGRLLV